MFLAFNLDHLERGVVVVMWGGEGEGEGGHSTPYIIFIAALLQNCEQAHTFPGDWPAWFLSFLDFEFASSSFFSRMKWFFVSFLYIHTYIHIVWYIWFRKLIAKNPCKLDDLVKRQYCAPLPNSILEMIGSHKSSYIVRGIFYLDLSVFRPAQTLISFCSIMGLRAPSNFFAHLAVSKQHHVVRMLRSYSWQVARIKKLGGWAMHEDWLTDRLRVPTTYKMPAAMLSACRLTTLPALFQLHDLIMAAAAACDGVRPTDR